MSPIAINMNLYIGTNRCLTLRMVLFLSYLPASASITVGSQISYISSTRFTLESAKICQNFFSKSTSIDWLNNSRHLHKKEKENGIMNKLFYHTQS